MQAQNQNTFDILTWRPANALTSKITLPLKERTPFYEMHTTVKPEFTPLLQKCLNRYRGYPLDLFEGFDRNPQLAKYMALMYENDYKWYGTLLPEELPDDEDRMLIRCLYTNPSPDAIDLMCKYPHVIEWDNWISGSYRYVGLNQSPIISTLLDKHSDKVDWDVVSSNPSAANYLTNHLGKINWYNLSANPSDYALDLLETYSDFIHYRQLSANTNPRAIKILKNKIDEIDWVALSSNPSAIQFLQEHMNQIFWGEFAHIQHPDAIRLIERELEHLDWDMVSVPLGENPAAVPILRNHLDWVNWTAFCINANTPESIQFIREHLDLVDWEALSTNEQALSILREFPDYVQESAFGSQDMFDYNYTYDYPAILATKYNLHQEYHAWAGHPSRMHLWKGWRINDFIDTEAESELEDSASSSF